MNNDTKVGLALGILVVGIASAFFFRLPQNKTQNDRVQKIAPGIAEIDKELQFRSNRPYLPPTPSHDIDGDHELQPGAFPELSQILYTGPDAPPNPLSTSPEELNPLNNGGGNLHVTEKNGVSIPATTTPPQLVSTESNLLSPTTQNSSMKQHIVKHGETLSSIAHHYLGSPVKFHDIYEANQDRMDSPDALKPGMTLNIPLKHEKSRSLPQTRSQTNTTTPSFTNLDSQSSRSNVTLGFTPLELKTPDINNLVVHDADSSQLSSKGLPSEQQHAIKPKRFTAVKKAQSMP